MLPSPFLRKVRYLSNLNNFERQTLVMLMWATDSRETRRQLRERGTRALWLLKETLNHLDCTSIKASKLQRQDAYIKVWKSIIHARHSKRLLWVPFSNTMTHNTTPVPFLNACASVLRPEWLHACLFLERGQLHLQTVQVCHTPTWLTCMSESEDKATDADPFNLFETSESFPLCHFYIYSDIKKESLNVFCSLLPCLFT